MIRDDSDSFARATDFHSYFPEWADRPAQEGPLQESDRNSYLAGGYAEEFGYDTQQVNPPAFMALCGDPEQSRLWCVQIAGLHPGYPECARPLDRDPVSPGDFGPAYAQSAVVQASSDAGHLTHQALGPSAVHFTVIRVGDHGRAGRKHVWLPVALTLMWKEFRIRRRELGKLF